MTETTDAARQGSSLEAMKLPELKRLASSIGLKGTGAMRKGDLISAIRSQGGSGSSPRSSAPATPPAPDSQPTASAAEQSGPTASSAPKEQSAPSGQATLPESGAAPRTSRRGRRRGSNSPDSEVLAEVASSLERDFGLKGEADRNSTSDQGADRNRGEQNRGEQNGDEQNGGDRQRSGARGQDDRTDGQGGQQSDNRNDSGNRNDNQRSESGNRNDGQRNDNQRNDNRNDDDESGGRRRRRRNRDRNNRRGRTGGGNDRFEDPVVNEDDVLIEVGGILDVLDNYGFVRRRGYLPSPEDAYVPMNMVRKHGLRKGDVITGAMKAPKENDGQQKAKYNPLVRLDTVNHADPEKALQRPEFGKLTPLYPQERLRLETIPTQMAGRIIDLVAPIGKGQRGLIVSPPKAGKTMVMQAIANSITTNNPEVHLMVVLVDERPEEVTDFQRTVKGEVISSTFDRPASDHTIVAELAIERAKRLVEQGRDVVILLDGITRLGRAYNLAAPASGRILSGGVDSAALFPPKRFFGAARNIEDGGSLTILATALVETGSRMDEVIFEEFKGTGNMELRLRREFADKRIFPAVDVDASSTRREELLLTRDELAIVWKLRRVLSGLDGQQALETLLSRMRKTQSNAEFLMVISKTTPGRAGEE